LAAATTALVREKAALAREAAERARADESLLLALQREKDAEAARELAVRAQQAAEVDRSRAMESRQTADVARATVERLLNDVLFDLRDELEPMGRLALLEPISKSAETYFASVPASADNDEQQRNRAVVFESRGGLLLAQGDAAGALASFEQGASLLRERLRQEEENVQRMHDLALGLERVGSAREALGEMKLAEAMYEEMGGLFERMKAMGEGAWRVDAALPAERLGDLRRMAGDATGAMRHYEAGLEWLKGLDEVTEVVRMRVAFLEEKMGGALEQMGQVEEAGARYEKALGLLREVHLEAPENRRYEAALAIAHGRLAKVRPGREGLEHAREQVERFAQLAELDPLHLSWQRQYAAALLQLGVSEEANGMGGEAVATFRRALGVIVPTQKAHPEVVGLVRERVAVHLRLAAGLLKAGKDAEAKEQAGESLRLMKGLERTAELDGWRKTAEALMGL
jgi:tetratricopeptide (TPR) repeat protein